MEERKSFSVPAPAESRATFPRTSWAKNWMPFPRWLARSPERNNFRWSIFGKRLLITGKRIIPTTNRGDFLTYDGNHWTEAGHKYVSEEMLKKFK